MVEKICKNCKYYVRLEVDGLSAVFSFGNCHKAPPSVDGIAPSVFPGVKEDDWCGGWEPKQSELMGIEKPKKGQK